MSLRRTQKLHGFRGNRIVTPPNQEPVTVSEIKTHLRLSGDEEDLYLQSLIMEARQEIEDLTGLAFITQEWLLTLDRWPAAREEWWDGVREAHPDILYGGNRHNYASVVLPRYPLVTVDTITVYPETGAGTTVAIADVFDVDTQSLRGRLTIKRGATWPIALRANNAIEIAYTAGYGSTAATVPAPLKRAIRQMTAYMYEHRGDGCEPKDAYSASGAKAILDRYRSIEV